MTTLDAYALCSIAVSLRVTQVVDIVRGVHAMIPKNLFTGALQQMAVGLMAVALFDACHWSGGQWTFAYAEGTGVVR